MKLFLGWLLLCCLAKLSNPSWWAITNVALKKQISRDAVRDYALKLKTASVNDSIAFRFNDMREYTEFEESMQKTAKAKTDAETIIYLSEFLEQFIANKHARFLVALAWLWTTRIFAFTLSPISFVFSARNYSDFKKRLESYPYEDKHD
jgi:hypothetical protein